MIGQQAAPPILEWAQAEAAQLAAPILAKLQATVGLFLADKAFLLDAQQRAAPAHMQTAQTLYYEQLELEGQLGQVLPAIQAGQYDLGTVTAATALYARIGLHRERVDRLRRQMGLAPVTVSLDWPTIALWGGGALALLGLVTRSLPVILVGGAAVGVGFYARGAA